MKRTRRYESPGGLHGPPGSRDRRAKLLSGKKPKKPKKPKPPKPPKPKKK